MSNSNSYSYSQPHQPFRINRRRPLPFPRPQNPPTTTSPESTPSHRPPSPTISDTEEDLQHERLQNANLLDDIAYEREKLISANLRISTLETALKECRASAALEARRNLELEMRLDYLEKAVLGQVERGLWLVVLDAEKAGEIVEELLGVVERTRRDLGEGVHEE